MTDLGQWLEDNIDNLIQAAVAELSQDATQQLQAANSVTDFYHSLLESVQLRDPEPLYAILHEWVGLRSAPTEGELTRLLPVVVKLKQVNAEQICLLCTGQEAINLLQAIEKVYDPAIIYLSNLEADAVLRDMRIQLEEARHELERLDKSKSDFVEVAAHELRTPITLVEGYTHMLRNSVPGLTDSPSATPYIEGIDSGVQRLKEIIRDMLDVSLISLGMIELHLQPVWFNHVMQALEHSMQHTLAQRGVELIVDYETLPGEPIVADPERLLQVFQKIVSNAIKYTPDGRQTIVMARRLTGFVDVMVIDNGIGIDPENLHRIFDMFSSIGDSSLHSSGKTKFRGGGPGLGLYISKGIIEAHGGNIWAESPGYDEEEYPGSTFHIMIPMRGTPAGDKITETFNNRFD